MVLKLNNSVQGYGLACCGSGSPGKQKITLCVVLSCSVPSCSDCKVVALFDGC